MDPLSSSFALSGGGVYSQEHGQALDGGAMRLAEVLHDYNPYFELQFIPERDRTGEAPYRVVNNTPGIARHVVRYVTGPEMSVPHKVLAEIFKGDLSKHSMDSILDEIELEERAAKLMQLKAQKDRAEEDEELLAFHISGGREKKHYLRYNGQTIER